MVSPENHRELEKTTSRHGRITAGDVQEYGKKLENSKTSLKDREFADTTKDGIKGLPSRPFDIQVRYIHEIIGFTDKSQCEEIARAINDGKINANNLFSIYNPKNGYNINLNNIK